MRNNNGSPCCSCLFWNPSFCHCCCYSMTMTMALGCCCCCCCCYWYWPRTCRTDAPCIENKRPFAFWALVSSFCWATDCAFSSVCSCSEVGASQSSKDHCCIPIAFGVAAGRRPDLQKSPCIVLVAPSSRVVVSIERAAARSTRRLPFSLEEVLCSP